MISFDTNLLLYSLNSDCAEYTDARTFFASLPATPGEVAVCELVLVELYVLLRNPAVVKNPLDPADAVTTIQAFRQHPMDGDRPSRHHLSGDGRSLALGSPTQRRAARRPDCEFRACVLENKLKGLKFDLVWEGPDRE
jgi:predicted nucleic acid-binding protein